MDREIIEELVTNAGYAVHAISQQTPSTYQITGDGHQLYIKRIPSDRTEIIRNLLLSDGTGIIQGDLLDDNNDIYFLMEAAEGRQLAKIIPVKLFPLFYKRKLDTLKSIFKKVGSQLQEIHQISIGEVSAKDDWTYIDRWGVLQDGKINSEVHHLFEYKSSVKVIEETITNINKLPGSTTIIHGDPNLRHIYIDNRSVTWIDLDAAKIAPNIVDRAILYCALRLMIARLPYSSKSVFNTLWDSFEQGYDKQRRCSETVEESVYLLRLLSLYLYYKSTYPESYFSQAIQFIDMKTIKRLIKEGEENL